MARLEIFTKTFGGMLYLLQFAIKGDARGVLPNSGARLAKNGKLRGFKLCLPEEAILPNSGRLLMRDRVRNQVREFVILNAEAQQERR